MENSQSTVHVLGIPQRWGQPRAGVEKGPQCLRDAGLVKSLHDLNVKVEDHGDIQIDSPAPEDKYQTVKHPKLIGSASSKTSEKVAEIQSKMKKGDLCLNLGGDHTVAIGTIHGTLAADPDAAVVWVDAHSDINPPLESPSGNIHGMPLAFLVHGIADRVPKDLPGFGGIKPCLHPKDLVFIGLRDIDIPERRVLKEYGIKCYDIQEVERLGIVQVMDEIKQRFGLERERAIHLSFDIDGLDPSIAPSTGTRVPGGLTLREGRHIVSTLRDTGNLRCMDLVEVNPELGTEADAELTKETALELVGAAFGKRGIQLY